MRLAYILTPIKRYAPSSSAELAGREIPIRHLGITKVVVVRTKSNGRIV